MFHDGAAFIDEDGERSADHPDLAAALQALLGERNASAAALNAQVEQEYASLQAEAEVYLQLVEAAGQGAAELD